MALPNSPPIANPCSSRADTTPTGAKRPIASYPGIAAVTSVPAVISPIEASIDALRPARSPYAPSTTAPNGRTT